MTVLRTNYVRIVKSGRNSLLFFLCVEVGKIGISEISLCIFFGFICKLNKKYIILQSKQNIKVWDYTKLNKSAISV